MNHNYYTAPGKFNIWRIQNGAWIILADVHDEPIEFSSSEDAHSFVETTPAMVLYAKYKAGGPEGNVLIKSAPTEMSKPISMISKEELEALLGQCENKYLIEGLTNLFESADYAERAYIWTNLLKDNRIKSGLAALMSNPEAREKFPEEMNSAGERINEFIMELYCGGSYQSLRASLATFYPLDPKDHR